jgi:hypothetical protein
MAKSGAQFSHKWIRKGTYGWNERGWQVLEQKTPQFGEALEMAGANFPKVLDGRNNAPRNAKIHQRLYFRPLIPRNQAKTAKAHVHHPAHRRFRSHLPPAPAGQQAAEAALR